MIRIAHCGYVNIWSSKGSMRENDYFYDYSHPDMKNQCQCLSHSFHRGSLRAGRYTPDRDSCGRGQEGIQRDMSGQTEESKSAAGQA